MMIRLDRSASTVLVVCTHPWCDYRALGNSDLEARSLGATHEASCHQHTQQFRDANIEWWRRRS